MNTNLLGNIYDAAISPELWPNVLDSCVEEVHAKTGALLNLDAVGGSNYQINVMSALFRNTFTEEDIKYWVTELSQYDEIGLRYGLTVPVQTVFRDTDVNPSVTALDSQPDFVFLREKLRVSRKLAARLIDNKRYITNLGFQFSSDVSEVPQESINSMQQLVPHIAKSLEMNILFARLQSTYSMVLAALDHVGLGLCIVDKIGRVIVVNKEAERILDSRPELFISKEKILSCPNELDNNALQQAVDRAVLGIKHRDTVAHDVIAISKTPTKEPILIEVSPLTDHMNEINHSEQSVLVQIIDIACQRHCSTKAFATAYQLTNAEMEVTTLIAQGLKNQEIADSRNTSVETVKTQIKAILSKGNVNSRVELVKKIIKSDPPVFGYHNSKPKSP